MTSIVEAIVFAVNMPPHAPAPGQLRRTISPYSSSVMAPASRCPSASKEETTSSRSPFRRPGAMVPP